MPIEKGSSGCPCSIRPACHQSRVLDFFLDACCLTRKVAQVIKLRPADITPALDLDFLDLRAVSLKDTLDAFTM